MTAKEFLEQARYLDRRIDSKLSQLESLRSLAMKVNSVFSDIPKNPDPHKLEKTIVKIVDLESEISSDIATLVDLKREIMVAINSVRDDKCRILLEMRYLSFKSWESIAVELSLDLRWVYRLHSKALSAVQKIILTRH